MDKSMQDIYHSQKINSEKKLGLFLSQIFSMLFLIFYYSFGRVLTKDEFGS